MKKYIILLSLLTSLFVFCLDISGQLVAISGNPTALSEKLKGVSICKWKNNAKTCLSLSFDDNNLSHNKIASILDAHGFKGTFVVIAGSMIKDSIKELIKNGHEIGSHTVTHPDLTTLDSSKIDYQLTNSKALIEKTFGIHCVTFAEPGHLKTEQSTRIAFRNYLFVRNYSEYSNVLRARWAFSQITTQLISLPGLAKEIRGAMKSGNMFVLNGHGLGSEGYVPSTPELISTTLDTIKQYSDRGDLWVAPMKEAGQYENLYHELIFSKQLRGDTLSISFNNYLTEKYNVLDSSLISFKIPKALTSNFYCISDGIRTLETENEYILTVDLKKSTCYNLILNLPPIALAGDDQIVEENSLVTLNAGSSFDYEGDHISYKWIAPSKILLSSADSKQTTFIAPEVAKDETYTFSLVVSDGPYTFTTDQINITVKQVNKAPLAKINNNIAVFEQAWVPLDGSGSSDKDGDKITYEWISPEGIDVYETKTAHPYFQAPYVDVNTQLLFGLIVSDGKLKSDTSWTIVSIKKIGGYFSSKYKLANSNTSDESNKMYIDVMSASVNGLELGWGDEIAAFDGDICVGSNIIRNKTPNASLLKIVAFGDDGDGNGFREGNSIQFRIYDSGRKREFTSIDVLYRNSKLSLRSNFLFQVGITQTVDLLVLTTGLSNAISEPIISVITFPNPFTSEITVNIETAIKQPIKVDMYDALGCCVKSIFNGFVVGQKTITVYDIDKKLLPGIYFLKVNSQNFKIVHKNF